MSTLTRQALIDARRHLDVAKGRLEIQQEILREQKERMKDVHRAYNDALAAVRKLKKSVSS